MNLIVVISYNCLFLIKIYAIMMIDSRSTAKNKSSFVSRFGKPFSFISDCKAIHQIWLQGRVIYLCSMTKALFLPTFLVCKYAKLQGDIYSTYLEFPDMLCFISLRHKMLLPEKLLKPFILKSWYLLVKLIL